MKTVLATIVGLVIVASAANASAQVGFFFGPPVPAPAVVVPPPAPVVTYYAPPVVAYTPGYVVSAGPVLPAPLYYSFRQRTYFRGPYYRSTVRFRGW
ncbi:MAG TPA: hypothetical protein VG826_22350 [Pirellulales bacterium]|nr:hypothetical protein [Pirellulales bacterium]